MHRETGLAYCLCSLAAALAATSCGTTSIERSSAQHAAAHIREDVSDPGLRELQSLAWAENLSSVARLALTSDNPDAVQIGIANISMLAEMAPLSRSELGVATTRAERVSLALDILEWTAERFRDTPVAAEALHTATNLLVDAGRLDDVRIVAKKLIARYPDSPAAARARKRLWDIETVVEGQPLALGPWAGVDGRAVDLPSLKGKYVLLYCWYEACSPCKGEMRRIGDVIASAGGSALAIGLNFDETPGACASAIARLNPVGRQVFMPGQRAESQIQAFQFPRVILIGPDGNVLARESSAEQLRSILSGSAGDKTPPKKQ
jgi:hypothetical protein